MRARNRAGAAGRRMAMCFCACAALGGVASGTAQAAIPTALDTGFATGGIFSSTLLESEQSGQFHAVAVQEDGKTVAGGYAAAPTALAAKGLVVRFTQTGALDTSFSGDGIATIAESGAKTEIFDVLSLSDGTVLAAGTSTVNGVASRDMLVAHLTAGGDLDTDFGGGDGIVTVAVGSGGASNEDIAYQVLQQSDGKIVLVGVSNSSATGADASVVRLTSDGSLDTSFGSGGVLSSSDTADDYAYAGALQSDGKIVIAGAGAGGARVARVGSSGTWDSSFGTAGVNEFRLGLGDINDEQLDDVVVLASGGIVAAGFDYAQQPDLSYLAEAVAVRLDTSGVLDTSFGGGDGIAPVTSDTDEHAYDVALADDGSLLLAGDRYDLANTRSAAQLIKLDANGAVDATFASSGKLALDPGAGFEVGTVAFNGGQVVLAGRTGAAPRKVLVERLGIDSSAPGAPATVSDGDGDDLDVVSEASRGRIMANWSASSDTGISGMGSYLYCVGTSTDACTASTGDWVTAGTARTIDIEFTAQFDVAYYTCVRAVDRAGNRSDVTCSDGVVTPNRAPSAPSELEQSLERAGSGYAMYVQWVASTDADDNLTGYTVQTREAGAWKTRKHTTALTARLRGFHPGDLILWRVCAEDQMGTTTCTNATTSIPWAMVLTGGDSGDLLIGERGADRMSGGDGSDVLRGRAGADQINAGSGADFVYAGAGTDTVLGGPNSDIVDGGRGNDAVATGSGDDVASGGSGNDGIRGGRGEDYLGGARGNDSLRGGSGDDWLSGHSGNDTLFGGNGDDFLSGGSGRDVLRSGDGTDVVRADDGSIDTVDCGPGFDIVDADPGDHLVNCEFRLIDTLARASGS